MPLECEGSVLFFVLFFVENRCFIVLHLSERNSWAMLVQQPSSGAPFPCYRAQTHLLLPPPSLVFSPFTRYDYFSFAPAHHYIPVCSYPSLLSFFIPCFCPCAALHICAGPVQYVKEANVCSVQNVISIYIFYFILWWFTVFPPPRASKERPALAMYLNKHDCCVCTPPRLFTHQGNQIIHLRQTGRSSCHDC